MDAEIRNFPKFVYCLSHELEQHYLFSIQMGIVKIVKLTKVLYRGTAYFKHADTDHVMTMSLLGI